MYPEDWAKMETEKVHPIKEKETYLATFYGNALDNRSENPILLHLGCGLDSRVFRIDPSSTVRWYDIDMLDVIELRRHLCPERHDYTMIGFSVTDPRWLEGYRWIGQYWLSQKVWCSTFRKKKE